MDARSARRARRVSALRRHGLGKAPSKAPLPSGKAPAAGPWTPGSWGLLFYQLPFARESLGHKAMELWP